MNISEAALQQPSLENVEIVTRLDRQALFPFLATSVVWLVLSVGLCAWFSAGHAVAWVVLLWSVCVLDLYALSRAVGATLGLASGVAENRGSLVIQALYLGMIKLTSLGILGTILSYGRSIPVTSLLMGTGTLMIVPLLGGFGWGQKELRHA